MEITLFEAIRAKRLAEERIEEAIKEFQDQTGLKVTGFNYSTMELIDGTKAMGFESLKIEL